jgi:hypothetical protein
MRAQMQNQKLGIQELGQARNGLPNPFNPYAKNNRGQDYGSPFYNAGTDPTAFTKQVYDTQTAARVATKDFGKSLLGVVGSMRPGKLKIDIKGDMLNKPFNTNDVLNNGVGDTSNEAAEKEFGLRNGGYIPQAQNGKNIPAGSMDIGTGYYNPSTKTITGYDGTGSRVVDDEEANWMLSQTSYGNNTNNKPGYRDPYSGWDGTGSMPWITASNQNSSSGAGSNGFTGDMGGYRFVDGKIVGNSGQGAGAGGYGVDPRAYRNQTMNPFGYLTSPQGMEAFGSAMKNFQPDDVYLSKLKGRMGLFGNKFVAKWNYGPDGQLVQDDGSLSQGTDLGHRDRNYGKLDQAFDRVRANINDRRGEGNYKGHTGHGVNQGNDYDMSVNNSTGYGGSGMGAMERLDSDKQPIKVQPAIPQSSSGYPEPSPYDPRMDYVPEQFDNGGMAGKLTIKQGYTPSGTSLSSGILAGMDMVSANKNVQQLSENAFLPDNIVPVLSDSRRRNPGGRGTWGVGPGLIGQETADNQPFDEYDGSGNSGNDLSSQFNYQDNYSMSRNGGPINFYEEGGVYELDEDEIQELYKLGGTIEYLDR